ncbi:MAG: hypothetical protein OIF48_16370 [Silicimonas sp.]|nr:hypothetical protein [Silicimonas sp.]
MRFSRLFDFGAAAGLSLALAPGALAQDWQVRSSVERGWSIGTVSHPSDALWLQCAAFDPNAPGADPFYGEGINTTPYGLTIGVADKLAARYWDGAGEPALDGVTLQVLGGLYPLPKLYLNELSSSDWESVVSLGSQVVLAFAQGENMVLRGPDRGPMTRLPGAGITDALAEVIRFCDAAWQGLGAPLPPSVEDLVGAVRAARPAPQRPAELASAPSLPLPQTIPPVIQSYLSRKCEGGWRIGAAENFSGSDIDGDGQVDILANWAGITCEGTQRGLAFCGAANCQIDLFLSTRGYANPEELLGSNARFVTDNRGRVAILRAGTASLCPDTSCDKPLYWNGASLQ